MSIDEIRTYIGSKWHLRLGVYLLSAILVKFIFNRIFSRQESIPALIQDSCLLAICLFIGNLIDRKFWHKGSEAA